MRAIIGAVSALALAGCATLNSGISRSQGEYAKALALSTEAQQVLKSATPYLPDNAPNDAILIYLAKNRPADVQARAVADATARALIMKSDLICEQYMSDIIKDTRTTKSVLGVSNLALSGAAGVTTPVRSANLLSALATFAGAADSKLTTTILSDKAPELLYNAVMAKRTEARTQLLTWLEDASLDDPPRVVMAHLAEYHNQCGLTVGINGVTESVQTKVQGAEDRGAQNAAAFVDYVKAQAVAPAIPPAPAVPPAPAAPPAH